MAVHAKPGSRVGGVVAVADVVEVAVDAPAREGEANDALLQLLAAALGVKARDLSLVSGHKSRDKVVRCPLPAGEALQRLQAGLA